MAAQAHEVVHHGERWLRAQPPEGTTAGPRLIRPGISDFTARTQPDGLWITLLGGDPDPVSAALLAIEVCGSWQNLADKRSRYAPAHAALLLEVGAGWLNEKVAIQKGGQRERWKLTEAWSDESPTFSDMKIPVRSLRVLFALPNDTRPKKIESKMYDKAVRSLALEAHEYLAPHSALGPNNASIRQLVETMMAKHILPK